MSYRLKGEYEHNYEIEGFNESSWYRVLKDGKIEALCMNITTAFEVIYKDLGGACGYLHFENFEEVESE